MEEVWIVVPLCGSYGSERKYGSAYKTFPSYHEALAAAKKWAADSAASGPYAVFKRCAVVSVHTEVVVLEV